MASWSEIGTSAQFEATIARQIHRVAIKATPLVLESMRFLASLLDTRLDTLGWGSQTLMLRGAYLKQAFCEEY